MKCMASEELKKITGLVKKVRKRYRALVKAGLIRSEMQCPKCNATNVDRTCKTFQKDTVPIWTGWYCHRCGHWWKKKESDAH